MLQEGRAGRGLEKSRPALAAAHHALLKPYGDHECGWGHLLNKSKDHCRRDAERKHSSSAPSSRVAHDFRDAEATAEAVQRSWPSDVSLRLRWCAPTQASMPMRQGGRLASRASTWPRDHFWRSTIAPRRSRPTI